MKVTNIGIIIKNDYGDTFPVALTTNMVSVIQNLLVQIPLQQQAIVGPDGQKAGKANPSIPIIPREVAFNWDEAYKPMLPPDEKALMEKLAEKYKKLDAENSKEVPGKNPNIGDDPLNPFNLSLEGEGRANVDVDEKKEAMDSGEFIDQVKKTIDKVERKDVTVTPDTLGMGTNIVQPGSG